MSDSTHLEVRDDSAAPQPRSVEAPAGTDPLLEEIRQLTTEFRRINDQAGPGPESRPQEDENALSAIESRLQGLEAQVTAAAVRAGRPRLDRLDQARRSLPANIRANVAARLGYGGEEPTQIGQAFRSFLAQGPNRITAEERQVLEEANREVRATLQFSDDVGGGYLVPDEFLAELIQAVDDETVIKGISRLIPLARLANLGVPSLDTDPNDFDWTTEIQSVTEDTALAFGTRELHPKQLSKLVKISRGLIQASPMNVEGIVRERMAYKFAITQEKAFMTGTGAGQPLGVFTASADGISTTRDTAAAATTDFTADELINTKYALKGQYQQRATWVFHRDMLAKIRKKKDANGQYLWSPGLTGMLPQTLLDVPYRVSEYAPNTFTTGKYVAIVGDFSRYWVAEVMALEVQVLLELYAETNKIGYIGRGWLDAMPVLEEAFSRLKLA